MRELLFLLLVLACPLAMLLMMRGGHGHGGHSHGGHASTGFGHGPDTRTETTSVEFAKAGTDPSPSDALEYVYAEEQ